MRSWKHIQTCLSSAVALGACAVASFGQIPDHPIITEVFTDPVGANDGPVGRDPGNLHQEYIEIYLPVAAGLDPALDKDALNLTFYEVEGDSSSSGTGLVNYRIDLPMFDLDASNGITPGAVARPSSGVVVIGWIDYVGDPPTGLAGTPSTRVALINGGVTSTTDYTFVAMNGAEYDGTTNFPVPVAISSINPVTERYSGIIQNGSGAYLLVNRDDPGYVTLYDDADVPPGESADPSLATGTVLQTSCLLDGYAGNDDSLFRVEDQPYAAPTGNDIDLETVLPLGGAFSLLIPQIAENHENGYARLFIDIAKTTEDAFPSNDDPVIDATTAYRTISNVGPLGPTPGLAPATTSPARLRVADASIELFDVLAGTTGRPGIHCANIGGNYAMSAVSTPGASSDPGIATFTTGDLDIAPQGQTLLFPSIAAAVAPTAPHLATVTVPVDVDAGIVNGGDPPVQDPSGSTTATITVLNPQTGQDANGQPYQATTFIALQGLPANPPATNEFLGTSLADFVAANLGGLVDDDRGNGVVLLDPLTDLSDPLTIDAMEQGMPDDPLFYINSPGPLGFPDLVTTILNSAENTSPNGSDTYVGSFNADFSGVRAIEMHKAETRTTGGTFSPTERVHFSDEKGTPGAPDSGLTDVNTNRGFELALIDSNVLANGGLETGATDDFGLIVRVGRVRAGATVVPDQFIFLSFMGGLEGADIDTVDVPPHQNQTVIIYVDLDLLDTLLGCETITALFVVDGGGSSALNVLEAFSLNVDGACAAPAVVTHPVSQSVCEGDPVTLQVVASGDAPLAYQWRLDGIDIPGATGATYSIAAASPSDNGVYDVVITNACGSATGGPANLTVNSSVVIVNDPVDTTACPGGSASFTVGASGGTSISYQWRRGTTDLVNGGNISGANSATLVISPASIADEAVDYNCVVSTSCPPAATSANASLTIVECGPIVVEAVGPRYLSVTPGPGPDPIAMLVSSAGSPCLPQYVQVDGTLDVAPVFQTPATWGTTFVSDIELLPATTYDVQTETVGGQLSPASSATTFLWGDVNNNTVVNFADISLVVKGFQGDFSVIAREAVDLVPCVTNRNINFADVNADVLAFQGGDYAGTGCPTPCP